MLIEILFILALILHVIGIAGSFLPVLPGPPLSWLAMVLCCIATPNPFMIVMTILMAVLVIFLVVFDYIAPGILTKKAGGCKKAEWGANIGLFVGMFFIPWGMLIGPFVGSFIGQILNFEGKKQWKKAVSVAFNSLLSIVVTSMFKCLACILMLFICAVNAIVHYS